MMTTSKDVMKVLRTVKDPEIGANLVDLGLIYGVKVTKDRVKIKMTFTSMFCPLAGAIDADIREKVGKIKGVKKVDVELVWEPPWTPERMSEELRAELGV